MNFIKPILPLLLLFFLVACKKEEPEVYSPKNIHGMLVLNEGLFQQNNSHLSHILEDNSIDNQAFEHWTGRLLGDTGNDLIQYGGKMYIVVNVSSTIEVLNAVNGSPIHQLQRVENGTPTQPRHAIGSHGKVFVCNFDGFVDVIDTNTLTVTQRIPVGSNPEDLSIANNWLAVTNSGGLNFPNVDSTFSLIDMSTMQETQRITVGKNPGQIEGCSTGFFINVRGNYGSDPGKLIFYDINTQNTTQIANHSVQHLCYSNGYLYFIDNQLIQRLHVASLMLDNSFQISITNQVQTPYGLNIHPTTGHLFVADAQGYTQTGRIIEYSPQGAYLASFSVGLNPSKILFLQ